MSLLEMVNEYQELLEEKESLAETVKANNAAIEEKKQEIAQQMIDDDCPKISCHGYTFSLSNKTMYSKKSEADLAAAEVDFFEVLREQGLGDLIKEKVSPTTLRKTVAELVEEQGDMPEELAEVINSYETWNVLIDMSWDEKLGVWVSDDGMSFRGILPPTQELIDKEMKEQWQSKELQAN